MNNYLKAHHLFDFIHFVPYWIRRHKALRLHFALADNCRLRRCNERPTGGKFRRSHKNRRDRGREFVHNQAGDCGQCRLDDRASRLVLEFAPAWTAKHYELLRLLLENNLAIYSSHLPLDAHPKLGNNAQLCAALGLKKENRFLIATARPSASNRKRQFPARTGETAGTRDRREAAIYSRRQRRLRSHRRRDRRRGRGIKNCRKRRRGHVHHRRRPPLDLPWRKNWG